MGKNNENTKNPLIDSEFSYNFSIKNNRGFFWGSRLAKTPVSLRTNIFFNILRSKFYICVTLPKLTRV